MLIRLLETNDPSRFKRHVENPNLTIDPDKLTPEMLDKIAEHLIQNALGSNGSPVAVADVKRRLEAGETVDVVCEDVTEKAGRMSTQVVLREGPADHGCGGWCRDCLEYQRRATLFAIGELFVLGQWLIFRRQGRFTRVDSVTWPDRSPSRTCALSVLKWPSWKLLRTAAEIMMTHTQRRILRIRMNGWAESPFPRRCRKTQVIH